MEPYGIHWFRRDLRVEGNPALRWNRERHQGRVVGVFCFDKKFLARPDFSVPRFQFFLETLGRLEEELRELGVELHVLDVGPAEAFGKLLSEVKSPPSVVSWNRDYEPFARERDQKMENFFKRNGIPTHTERDHLLIEPEELYRDGDPAIGYRIFTPFSKRWLDLFRTPEIQARISLQVKCPRLAKGSSYLLPGRGGSDLLERYRCENAKRVTIPIPEAGSTAAKTTIAAFSKKLEKYPEARDIPSVNGTSHASIFLKNGSLNIGYIIGKLNLRSGKFLSELIWREFYYHILWRHPNVETEAFQPKFRKIRWENREDWFEAWKEGQTGFPIVDAGMRQLKTTGWMHNRVRMIVASFLTKDLLIDWRWGERLFMERLLDGDLAPNNGGWQWAASTGCDPQPYFRIFNPKLQSLRFDPEGKYIRKYVPELKDLTNKEIHEPPAVKRGRYPNPIVDHRERSALAIETFREASGK